MQHNKCLSQYEQESVSLWDFTKPEIPEAQILIHFRESYELGFYLLISLVQNMIYIRYWWIIYELLMLNKWEMWVFDSSNI